MTDEPYDGWSDDHPSPEIIDPPPDEPSPKIELPPPEGIIPLGHNRGIFYYYSMAGRQIVPLSAGNHNKNTLMAAASSVYYWEKSRFLGTKGGILWDDAIDWLMGECRQMGIFDPAKIRGRGAWIDDGRAVLHVGDCLIVDGKREPLALPETKYLYEAAIRLGEFTEPPLATRDAHKLIDICQRLPWDAGISGTLLAGFLVTAPICGGMGWRPSCWLTGPAGSGKSWIGKEIALPMLAGVSINVLGRTTEAGLRQTLASDALPVTFDEIEGDSVQAQSRIQDILDLIKVASTETAGVIAKGTQNQSGAKVYKIRSAFFLSSINVSIVSRADESRITVLSVREGKLPAAVFHQLELDVAETITPAYAAAMVARSVRLLPVIRANAETFARAVAAHLGTRRSGDQIGAMLAGAYSLHSQITISDADAKAYVERQEWAAVAPKSDQTETDELKLLTRLTQAKIRINGGQEPTIERLIQAAWGEDTEWMSAEVAERELRSIGIRSDPGGVFVSNTHPALAKLLVGTPWASSWGRSLQRLPGAESWTRKIRFGSMSPALATWLPRTTLEKE